MPREIQAAIDQLIRDQNHLMAIKTFCDNGSPRPSIGAGKYLLYVRYQAMGLTPGSPSA